MSKEACFYWGFGGCHFSWTGLGPTQKGRTWFSAKNPRGQSSRFSCGTGGGPHGQSQIINLVIGVVPCPSRIADATRVKVGACGPKLTHGLFCRAPLAGRSKASLPVPLQSTRALPARQARMFLPREGAPAGAWRANHALQRMARSRHCWQSNITGSPSLSLGR